MYEPGLQLADFLTAIHRLSFGSFMQKTYLCPLTPVGFLRTFTFHFRIFSAKCHLVVYDGNHLN